MNCMQKKRNGIKGIAIALLVLSLMQFPPSLSVVRAEMFYPASRLNSYNELQAPAQVSKIGDTYFIVDSGHNQVIYSKSIGAPLGQWSIMAGNLSGPHAVAGDGTVYLVADTENHRVISYRKRADGFQEQQIFESIGERPHYVVYDRAEERFYVWSSMTGEMYLFRRMEGTTWVCLEQILAVPELMGSYVRSFTIEGDLIYLPCVVQSCIYVADKHTMQVLAVYPVPTSLAGIVQITGIENRYYITVSTDQAWNQDCATIIRTESFQALSEGRYEDLNGLFGGDGAPYYISRFDGAWYTLVLKNQTRPCICRFEVSGDVLEVKKIGGS